MSPCPAVWEMTRLAATILGPGMVPSSIAAFRETLRFEPAQRTEVKPASISFPASATARAIRMKGASIVARIGS